MFLPLFEKGKVRKGSATDGQECRLACSSNRRLADVVMVILRIIIIMVGVKFIVTSEEISNAQNLIVTGGYGKSGCHPFFRQNLTFWRKIFFGDEEESAGASTAGVLLYRDSK